MTEQRPPAEPGNDDDEFVRDEKRRPTGDDPEGKDTNPLLREGADAPDAADIEDPDEQL
jgi:hypothetical protein